MGREREGVERKRGTGRKRTPAAIVDPLLYFTAH